MDHRQAILTVFTRKHLLSLQPDALKYLLGVLEEHGIAPEDVVSSLDTIAQEYLNQDDCSTIVTRPLLVKAYESVMEKTSANAGVGEEEDIDPEHHLHFINAFEMPWWHFSHERQTFERAPGRPSIAGTPESRALFLRDRHNIIKQTVLRNENFSPPAFAGRDRTNYLKLTSTQNLLGRSGGRFLLFGMLTRSPEGRLCLEDLDGIVPLDISQTGPSEGLFTEGAFVLVEGEYTDEEVLSVIAIGHPPSERRSVSRSIFGHIDFLGKGATTVLEDAQWATRIEEFPDLTVFAISDVQLDNERTMKGLQKMFQSCVDGDFIPKVFILCGNFSSRNVTTDLEMDAYRDNFTTLGDLIVSFPRVNHYSHFLFVPGPNDPWSSDLLPRRPIPSTFTQRLSNKIAHAVFGSNPCRIKFMGQEIVVFREDLMAKMVRNLVGVKPNLEGANLKKYLVQTILDQGHLSPLPMAVQATFWEYDHSLRLYPMPTAVILADSYERYEVTYEGCHVLNPGTFLGPSYGFSTYYMATSRSLRSEIPYEDEERSR